VGSPIQEGKEVSSMSVRAKFKVTSITTMMGSRKGDDGKYVPAEARSIKLIPVIGGSPENDSFFQSTPTGEINLGVLNEEAWPYFELNGEYYVDFSSAKEAVSDIQAHSA
jgi:hypothetical protein